MAIKFGTQGWVTQINADGGTDNVHTVQYPVNGVNTVVWKRPMTVTITGFDNYMRIDSTKPGILKPGYNSTSVSASYWSEEPKAMDFTTTPGGDACYWTKPTPDQTTYGYDLYYEDYIHLQYFPFGQQFTDYWGYGLYYLTPTAGEVEPNGWTKITNDGTYTLPALHKNYYVIRGTCNCGTWVEMAYKTTNLGNWTTVPSTATYGNKDYFYRSTINISRVATTGLRYVPVNTKETESGVNYYLCYYTPVPNTSNQYYAYFGHSDDQTISLGFYVEYTHQVQRPAQSDPVTVYLRPTEVQGYFYRVNGTVKLNGTDATTTLNNLGYIYWDSLNKSTLPTAPINYAENNHPWGNTAQLVNLVGEPDRKVNAYIKDVTGGYIPSSNGQEWAVYSGTRMQANTIYYQNNDTEYISNYTWNLGTVNFDKYYKVTFGIKGTLCHIETAQVGPYSDSALYQTTKTYYIPFSNHTCSFTITGSCDSSSRPEGPLYWDTNTGSQILGLTATIGSTMWSKEFAVEPTQDSTYIWDTGSLTWSAISDIIDTWKPKSKTVGKFLSSGGSFGPVAAFLGCVQIPVPSNWDKFQGKIYGAWNSSANPYQITSYTDTVPSGQNYSRIYYTSRKSTSNSTNTFYFTKWTANDLIMQGQGVPREWTPSPNSLSFIGYSSARVGYGQLVETWNLTSSNVTETVLPQTRNTASRARQLYRWLSSPTTSGNTNRIQWLYNHFSTSIADNDSSVPEYITAIVATTPIVAPANWNTTSGSPSSVTLFNLSIPTQTSAYTATSYEIMEYMNAGTNYANVMIVQTSSQPYTPTTTLLQLEWELDPDYLQASGGSTGYLEIRFYNPNNFDVTVDNIVGVFEDSSGTYNFGPGYDPNNPMINIGTTILANSYSDWGLIGYTACSIDDYFYIDMDATISYNGSSITGTYTGEN